MASLIYKHFIDIIRSKDEEEILDSLYKIVLNRTTKPKEKENAKERLKDELEKGKGSREEKIYSFTLNFVEGARQELLQRATMSEEIKKGKKNHLKKISSELEVSDILEFGILRAEGSQALIDGALKSSSPVSYYGIDLFQSWSRERVKDKLDYENVSVKLFKGDSKDVVKTLDLPEMDLIYIDGGHDYETVHSDWNFSKNQIHEDSVILFDDYELLGVKKVVDNIGNQFKKNIVDISSGFRRAVVEMKSKSSGK